MSTATVLLVLALWIAAREVVRLREGEVVGREAVGTLGDGFFFDK